MSTEAVLPQAMTTRKRVKVKYPKGTDPKMRHEYCRDNAVEFETLKFRVTLQRQEKDYNGKPSWTDICEPHEYHAFDASEAKAFAIAANGLKTLDRIKITVVPLEEPNMPPPVARTKDNLDAADIQGMIQAAVAPLLKENAELKQQIDDLTK